jgi:ribosomal protein S18 acetylase RimI-like enzyme
MTIQISILAEEHLPTVIRLLNEEFKGSYEFYPFDCERVLARIHRRQMTVRVATENGKVIGLVGTRPEEHGEEDIDWLAAEGQNQKQTKNMLVFEVEKRAKSKTVSTAVREKDPATSEWIERGYILNPGWLRMSTELASPSEVPSVPRKIELRTLKPNEEPQLIEGINAGFGWERLQTGIIEEWKSIDPPFTEEWVQIAVANGKIVSAVVARPDTEYNDALNIRRGYLGPTATLPDYRNMQLASALTIRAMNFLLAHDFNSVRLGTSEKNASSIRLLKKLGFHVDDIRKILRKNLSQT